MPSGSHFAHSHTIVYRSKLFFLLLVILLTLRTHATDPETLLTDPDFRAAVAGDSGPTVLQALEKADERGVFFQTMGTEQYSGKSYLSGGELPVGLSKEVLTIGNVARKQLKAMKKADVPRHFLSANLVDNAVKEKMNSYEKFVEQRCVCFLPSLHFIEWVISATVFFAVFRSW